jgi:hypothetical protein
MTRGLRIPVGNTMNIDSQNRRPSPLTASVFRIMGALAILFGLLFLFLDLVNMNARKHGGHDLSGVMYITIYFVLVGIGMLFLRRVFAVLIALPSLAAALWLAVGSIVQVPFPWILINIAFASILLIPAYLTVKAWRELK